MARSGPIYLAILLFLTLGAERAGLQADVPPQSDRVVTYTIQAQLFPERQEVHGAMELTWRNTSDDPVGQLFFHLYLNAFKDKDSTYIREGDRHGKRGADWDEDYPGWVRVNSMSVADGPNLWTDATRHFVVPDDGNDRDRTLARVDLAAPVDPGQSVTLKVDFVSRLPRVLHRTGWAGDPHRPDSLFFMVAQWFPKIAVLRRGPDGKSRWNRHQFHRNTEFFADYGVYHVSITAPQNYVIGATGKRVSGPKDNGDDTITVVHHQEDVHDFAWTASPHFKVREFKWSFDQFVEDAPGEMGKRIQAVLTRTAAHLDVPPEQIKPKREVSVRLLLQPDHAGLASRFKWAVGAALACYGTWFGAYPYEVLTIVDPPAGGGAAGGMEYPTLITVWGDRTAPAYATGMEGVTIHEFGHQFFYGLVGSNEFEEAWLDEGFTSYTDARVYEVAYGPAQSHTRYPPVHTPYFRPFAAPSLYSKLNSMFRLGQWLGKLPHPWKKPDSFAPVPGGNGLWEYLRDMPAIHLDAHVAIPQPEGARNWVLGTRSRDAMVMPGWLYSERSDYAVNSYGKPTVFLYCLRGLMGEAAFDRAMHAYATGFRFGHPTTEDFLKTVRAHTPEDSREPVDGFVDAMVESAARLDVAIVSADQRELANGKWLYRIRLQRRGDIPVPIQIRVDGEILDTWQSRGRETSKTFVATREGRFEVVRIGPKWLESIDADLSNNARVADGREDYRAAVATAARWSLYVEEIVRSYAGLSR